jgi:hypothetical protein
MIPSLTMLQHELQDLLFVLLTKVGMIHQNKSINKKCYENIRYM